jgi:hypothetical protein
MPDVLIALLLALGSAALYVATCAPSVLFGDSGEFQFVPYILGIAHPTGYPLYSLLGWFWSHGLPLGDVAYRMNLFSAVWAALATGLSYPLALRFVSRAIPRHDPAVLRLAAICASATFAVGGTFWRQAVIAEVYALNAFFVVLVLWLLLRLMDRPFRLGHGFALAVTFGLSLTHHRTMLLLVPGMLAYVWLVRRRASRRSCEVLSPNRASRWRVTLVLLAGLLLPLVLYAYLPLRAPHIPYATLSLSESQMLVLYPNTWRGFLDHVTATVFAGNLRVSPGLAWTPAAWVERLVMAWQLLRGQVGLVGAGLAVIGLVQLTLRRAWAPLVMTGVCYLVGVAFNLVYAIGDVAVLFVPSYLFVGLWIGAGIAALAGAAADAVKRIGAAAASRQGLARAVAGLGLALPAVLLVTHLPLVNQSSDTVAEAMWRPILARPIPPGAVLLTNDRDEMMPLWYRQYVEGQRPDVLGLFPGIVTDPAYGDLGGLVDEALSSGRPVYLIKPMPGLEVKVHLEPMADMVPLVKVAGPAADSLPRHSVDATFGGVVHLEGYDLAPDSPQPGDALTVSLFWQPQAAMEWDYTSYVHVVNGSGAAIAQSDHRPGGDYYPTRLWKPGEVLRDSHVIALPRSTEPGTYRLQVGMYQYPSMQPLGERVEAGTLTVVSAH